MGAALTYNMFEISSLPYCLVASLPSYCLLNLP